MNLKKRTDYGYIMGWIIDSIETSIGMPLTGAAVGILGCKGIGLLDRSRRFCVSFPFRNMQTN